MLRTISGRLVLAIFVIVLAGVPATAQEDNEQPIYTIGIVPWAGWAPAQVAESLGFWTEQGIDVRVIVFSSNQEVLTALDNGMIDIGFDMIGTAIGQYMDGKPVVILGETNWSHGGDKIIIKRGARLDALKGEPIGVYLNKPSVTFFLNKFLNNNKLKLSDFRVVELRPTQLANAFIEGDTNLIVAYDPDAGKAVREGNGLVVATSASYEGVIPEGMIAMDDIFKRIPEDSLRKIIKGWVKAANWVSDPANWKEYSQLLNVRTFAVGGPYSEEALNEMVYAVRIHSESELLARNRDGGGLEMYLSELRQFLRDNRMLKKDFSKRSVLRNDIFLSALTK